MTDTTKRDREAAWKVLTFEPPVSGPVTEWLSTGKVTNDAAYYASTFAAVALEHAEAVAHAIAAARAEGVAEERARCGGVVAAEARLWGEADTGVAEALYRVAMGVHAPGGGGGHE